MPKRNVLWMLAVVAVAVGTAWFMRRTPQARHDRRVRPDAMVDAYNKIIENHYPPVDPLELKQNAVSGMAEALDPQSIYVPYDKADAFRKRMKGRTRGTGMILDLSDKGPVIGCVHPNSPADNAGLTAGDIIVLVNSLPTFNMSLEQVNRHLSGDREGKVQLRVIFARGSGPPRDVTLALDEYSVELVTGLYRDADRGWAYTVDRDEGLAYIRVSEFVVRSSSTSGTVEQFKRAFRRPSLVRGLVLDLRGNPGGELAEAVALSDLFLNDEPIVTVLGNGTRKPYGAHAEGTYPEIPLVVLIDSDTASAAEIVAGALSHADRAILVGSPSRGKHSVQTPLLLEGKLGLLHLTTARFFFPQDLPETDTRPAPNTLPPSAGKPIGPHVLIPADPDKNRQLQVLRWRAASVPPTPTTLPASQPATSPGATIGQELIRHDAQLAAAVELLKNPARIRETLQACAEARKRKKRPGPLPTTRPASGGARVGP
ncbi:MAG: S41 family peptidase [Phycisphaerae bacterium]|jgi:carboxyl-terminal processing protease|nr:S41 family peptidase [Phycisphaerae bacterium]